MTGTGAGAFPPRRVIVIGASTGGTEAVKEVLAGLLLGCPPVLVVQHMPESFTPSFARRLDSLCRIRVKEAEEGEPALAGHAYIAPGHSHLRLAREGGGYRCALSREAPVSRHRPSVDVLFRSAADSAGAAALAVILTGMGKDGAEGMLELRRAGAHTIAQDRESCVVFGMPRAAIALEAAAETLPLAHIAPRLLQLAQALAARR